MLKFPENIVLEDERAMLRPLQEKDLEYFIPYAINEQDTWKYSSASAAGPEAMTAYVQHALRQRLEEKEYPFIIFDKASNEYAGSSRFYDIQLKNQTTQLGYTWYGKKFRRTGLNRHCKRLMLGYAFEQWGMERVEFRADNRNEASINAMKAIGCTVEGILRSNNPTDLGVRRDSIVLSILRKEWFENVKESLSKKIR